MAQDENYQEVRRCKGHISKNTSQTAKKSNNPVPTSAAVRTLPKAVLTHNILARVRTSDMDTETFEEEKTLLELKAPRKPGRPPPIMMTNTTNNIQLQINLEDNVKGEYKFRSAQNRACILKTELADYSAMISYLEKNNLHYFTFSPNSEKPIKAVICHLPPRYASGRYFQQP
jgi:hypothetical protein